MRELAPVSVVVPCWRCRDTITRAVESIASQTWLPREVILVDDASDDGTVKVLNALADRYRQGWVQVIELTENGGPSAARNAGWKVATSPYIAFLDADDAWHPRKLEIQIAWMEAHPEAAITGTQTAVIECLHHARPVPEAYSVTEITFRRMLLKNMLPTRSVVMRANMPHRFLPGKRYCQDYHLWLTAMSDGHRAFLLELPLSYSFKAEFGAGGLTSHLWAFHCDIIDTYRRLYRAGRISGVTGGFLEVYSLLKLIRRWFLSS